MKLTRTDYLETGIFGFLADEYGANMYCTLEHAYPIVPDGGSASTNYAPKLPNGIYECIRGMHQLQDMIAPFETFEITGVPGHTNILFHSGNFNSDSAGCVLLGMARIGNSEITSSKIAFQKFMEEMTGIDSFELEVS